jgi:putative two-component system response regulator
MESISIRKKVLIVDDDASIGRMLGRILKDLQCENSLAQSAEEARLLIKEVGFDLILCDIHMPGESGIDLIKYALSVYPDTAIIMVSGEDDPQMVEKALEIGVYGYIVKPFKISEVIINISSAFRRQMLEMERRLYRENLEQKVADRTASLRRALEGIIQVNTRALESRDPYTAGHQHRVALLAVVIAKEMNIPKDQLEGIRMAALIHDLGKISIPAEILSKPSKLTEIEFDFIKTHPQAGYAIIADIEFPWPIAQMVLQHHEKMNGTGYPQGLCGEDILLEARIICVADVVEAMVSHRPYRAALGTDAALDEISRNRGVLYDSQVVDACLSVFMDKGFMFE